MSEQHVTVTVQHVPGGIEIQAAADDVQVASLRLAADVALTLADDITMACEGRLRVVA